MAGEDFSLSAEEDAQVPVYDPSVTDLGAIEYDPKNPMGDVKPKQTFQPIPLENDLGHNVVPHDPETDFSIPDEIARKSPLELTANPQNIFDKIGFGVDRKPVLDMQNVDDLLRWKTQLFFDNADEKADFLKQELGPNYTFDVDPLDKTNVILKKKGTRYWGRVDPGNGDAFRKEIAENVDGIAQALAIPASALSGALAAGGIEGVRQLVKTQLSDKAEFSYASTAVNAASGGLVGGISGLMGAGKKAATDAATDAANRLIDKTGKIGVVGRIKQAATFFDSPQYILQELGAGKKAFQDFGKDSLESNVSYLLQNHPEFKAAITEPFSLKGKSDALQGLLKDTGNKLGEFYGNPENVVKVADILDSPASQMLAEATEGRVKGGVKTTLVDRAVRGKAARVQRDTLEKLGTLILPEKSIYLKAFRENKLNQLPSIQKMGFKTDNEAMAGLLRDRDITAADAQALVEGIKDNITFGKAKGQIKSVNTINKYALDSVTSALQSTIEKTGNVEAATAMKLYHELHPIAQLASDTVAQGKTENLSFVKFIPGALNGVKRGGLLLAARVLNRTEARGALRSLTGSVDSSAFDAANGAPVSASMRKAMMGQLFRGGSFLEAKTITKKQFLPRDSSAYFADPGMVNTITQQIQDRDLTDTMVRQIDNGNKEGFANTLSTAANEFPDLFDPAPYKSLVKGPNGDPVLTDKYDREEHRKWIEANITDNAEKFRHLKALNQKQQMIQAPYEIPKPNVNDNIKLSKSGSAVSRVAASLKSAELVELGDGSERQAYDY